MQRRKEGWTREIKSNRNFPPPSSSHVPSVFRPISVPRASPDIYNTLPSSVQDTCKYLPIIGRPIWQRVSLMWPATSYISRHRRYMVLSLKRNFLLLFFFFFPSSPSDSRRPATLPLPGGSICGDFNPWQTAFRFKDGIEHPTSPFFFSSLLFADARSRSRWCDYTTYDLLFARARVSRWTWCVYICRKKGEGIGVRALGEFRILTDESFRELPFARERSLLFSPRVPVVIWQSGKGERESRVISIRQEDDSFTTIPEEIGKNSGFSS